MRELLSLTINKVKQILSIVQSLKGRDTYKHLEPCEVLLICHDADRFINLGGAVFSPLIDPVGLKLSEHQIRVSQLSHPFSVLTNSRAHGSPKQMNRSYLLSVLLDKAMGRIFPTSHPRQVEKLWKAIFQVCKPKILITIGAPIEMCRAAECLGILNIEILHGYRYESIPWGYDDRLSDELPDLFFALDDLSSDLFRTLVTSTGACHTVDNPWYEFLNGFHNSRHEAFLNWSKLLDAHLLNFRAQKQNILVCLQWGYAKDEMFKNVFQNGLFPLVLDRIVAETAVTHNWIFRLHPVQMYEKRYKQQREYLKRFTNRFPNALSYEIQHVPLPIIFQHVDFHMTPGSGSTSEAITFGVPTLILDNKSEAIAPIQATYATEIEEGKVLVWDESVEQLREWIQSDRKFPPKSSAHLESVTKLILENLEKIQR